MSNYPKRNEDGKVLNPDSGNFVTVGYAERMDFLEEAEQATQEYFKEQDDAEASVGPTDIPETSGGLETTTELANDLEDDEIEEYFNETSEEAEETTEELLQQSEDEVITEEEFMAQFEDEGDMTGSTNTPGESLYTSTEQSPPQEHHSPEQEERSEDEYVWVRQPSGLKKKVHWTELEE